MVQDDGMQIRQEAQALSEAICSVSEYTGFGRRECRQALAACDNDPLVACGYLHYQGCLVNLNGQDREAWTLDRAREYARLLMLDDDGRIGHAPSPAPKRSGPGLR